MLVILKSHYLIIISQVFVLTFKTFLKTFFLPRLKCVLAGVLYRLPDKPELDNSLKESNILNIQECYWMGDFNINLLSGNKMLLDK